MAFCWSTAEKDVEQMRLFSKTVNSTYPLTERYHHSPEYPDRIGKHYVFSTSRANRWAEKLKENFGIIQHKTKRFPPPNLKTNKEKLSYISGYADGDGTIYVKESRPENLEISFCSCNQELLLWIKDFIENLNLPVLREMNEPQIQSSLNKNCYYYRINGFRASVLHELIMRIGVKKLTRKWENVKVVNCIQLCKQKPEWPSEIYFQNILNS